MCTQLPSTASLPACHPESNKVGCLFWAVKFKISLRHTDTGEKRKPLSEVTQHSGTSESADQQQTKPCSTSKLSDLPVMAMGKSPKNNGVERAMLPCCTVCWEQTSFKSNLHNLASPLLEQQINSSFYDSTNQHL